MELYQKKIIELFIEQELILADIYERFSDLFPEYRDFWRKMAGEEKEHASWVQHLLHGVVSDKVFFAEGKTRSYTVTKYIEYLKSTIAAFEKNPPDIIRALSISRDIENALIERNMFSFFEGDSKEVQKVISILEAAQYEHCSCVDSKLKTARKGVQEHA